MLLDHTLYAVVARDDNDSGQGLLLGVQSALNLSVQPFTPACGNSGALWVQITVPSTTRRFIGVVYVPPETSQQLRNNTMNNASLC